MHFTVLPVHQNLRVPMFMDQGFDYGGQALGVCIDAGKRRHSFPHLHVYAYQGRFLHLMKSWESSLHCIQGNSSSLLLGEFPCVCMWSLEIAESSYSPVLHISLAPLGYGK